MIPALVPALILFALYAVAGWVMLRSVSRPRLDVLAGALTVLAILVHTAAIVHVMRMNGPFSIGLLEAILMLAWTLAVVAAFIGIDRQNRALAAILLAIAAGASGLTRPGRTFAAENTPGWELTAHILLSMGAAALIFAAAVTGILLLFLHRRLRSRRIADLPSVLPPLESLEQLMFRLIASGFVLLSLALFTGFVFVTNLFAQHLVHKTVLAVIAWLLFAVLLFGRARFGWRGRAAVSWTVSGFVFLALSYFGSKFVLEYLLGRHWG